MTESNFQYSLKSATGKWTISSCIIASSMAFIDSTALNVILPSLQEDLSATGTDLFWVLNSYLLMLASLILVGGSIGDLLGRVRIFKIGIILFTLASIACGFVATINQLIIFRTLQGVGGALMIPGSLSIISATFSDKEKGAAIGTWSATTTIVTVGGPILGGALADIGLWRYIFFINVPLGLLSFLILTFKVPESKSDSEEKIDWQGATTLALSLAAFTFGLLNIPEVGASSPKSYIPLIIGVISFIGFIRIESRSLSPMVPLQIFKNRCFSGVNLATFFLYAGLGGGMLFLSLNLIQVQGYSQTIAGMTFLPFSFIMALTARRIGALSDKWGTRRFLIVGPTVAGIGFLSLGLIGQTNGPSEFWLTFFPGIVIFALGMAITVVPLTSTVMRSLPNRQAGVASGVNNSITRIAGTFMNAVLGAGAVIFFTLFVSNQVNALGISSESSQLIIDEAINLGESKAPSSLNPYLSGQIQKVYKDGFIYTYQLICYLSAAMAFLSAIIVVFMVKDYKGGADE